MGGKLERQVISRAYQRILRIVDAIPRGRVITYGSVANAAGMPRAARVVAGALRAAARPVPWHRVLGQRRPGYARVSIKDPIGGTRQRKLLLQEGVRFGLDDTVELEWFGWAPATAALRKRKRPAR